MAANKEQQALERLAPKLSALRKTLRGEERKLLDRMVLSLQSEVQPHSASVRQKQAAKTTQAEGRWSDSKTPQAEGRWSDSKTSEVSLHSANVRQKEASKTTQAEGRWNLRIELDARAGVYRITTD